MYAGELGTISVATGVIMNAIIFALTHCLVKKYKPHLISALIFTDTEMQEEAEESIA